ncbi:MAG: hypothetical protein LN545_01505, partial [Candidatus Megaira endosymbiont of Carteria cerasiformis]
VQFRDIFFHACGLPFFVKKELYHRHHHLATLVSTIYLCNPYPELGYNVKFDQTGQQFTKAQQEIKCETTDLPVPNPLWSEVAQELINDSILQEEFIRLSILGETL